MTDQWIDQVRNCRLVHLLDLDLGRPSVRGKVVAYLNRLVDIGVAGFRVDAVKHMWPADLSSIYDSVNNLSTAAGFAPNTRPFIFNEVAFGLLKHENHRCSKYFFEQVVLIKLPLVYCCTVSVA